MKKILIINLGGIGDALLSTPALRAIKLANPKTQVTLMIVARVCEVVRPLSYIDEIVVFPMQKILFFRDIFLLLSLRRRKFDLAINMRTIVSKRGSRRIKFILDVVRPKVKAGRDTEGKGYFFDIKIPEPDIGHKYEMEYDIDTVKALGANVPDRRIDFEVDDQSENKLNAALEKDGVSRDEILIGVHPGGVPSHRWPLENFSVIIKAIQKKMRCRVVITGSQDERRLAEKLALTSGGKIINFAGLLTLRELGALLKRCRLYISNDTGPMHIAAVLNTPLVAIFGPGYIERYDPRNISQRAVVIHGKADCAPCNKAVCKTMHCLKQIDPQEVIRVALRLAGEH